MYRKQNYEAVVFTPPPAGGSRCRIQSVMNREKKQQQI